MIPQTVILHKPWQIIIGKSLTDNYLEFPLGPGGDGKALEGGGGGAPLGIVGLPNLLGGSELVGEGDLFDGRFIEEGFKL